MDFLRLKMTPFSVINAQIFIMLQVKKPCYGMIPNWTLIGALKILLFLKKISRLNYFVILIHLLSFERKCIFYPQLCRFLCRRLVFVCDDQSLYAQICQEFGNTKSKGSYHSV